MSFPQPRMYCTPQSSKTVWPLEAGQLAAESGIADAVGAMELELLMAEELNIAEELSVVEELTAAEELVAVEEPMTAAELEAGGKAPEPATAPEVLLLAGPGGTRAEDEDVVEELDVAADVELRVDEITALLGAAPARRMATLVLGLATRLPGSGLG